MSGNQSGGFDVIYQISTERFLNVLRDLFVNDLPLALDHVGVSVPLPLTTGGTQAGVVALLDRPALGLTISDTDANQFTLTLEFRETIVSLDSTSIVERLPPTSAGSMLVRLHLSIDTQTDENQSQSPISIGRAASPSVATLTSLSAFEAVLPVPAGATRAAMVDAVTKAVEAAVVRALEGQLPYPIPISLQTPELCGLRPRELRMRFLRGVDGGSDALGFFVTVRDDALQGLTEPSTSQLGQWDEGALIVSNDLLLRLVCCFIRASSEINVGGQSLGAPDLEEGPAPCCRWDDLKDLRVGGYDVARASISVCVINGEFLVELGLHLSGTGWYADPKIKFRIGLRLDDGLVLPEFDEPHIEVNAHLRLWAYIVIVLTPIGIAALVGLLFAGPGGGLEGAKVGAIIGALIAGVLLGAVWGVKELAVYAIRRSLGQSIGAVEDAVETLYLLPPDVTKTFGTLDLLRDLKWDDLAISGYVALPDEDLLSAADDLILSPGQLLDLDRGEVLDSRDLGAADLDFDLVWLGGSARREPRHVRQPSGIAVVGLGGGVVACSSARFVVLNGVTFGSLTQSDVMTLVFPGEPSWIRPEDVPIWPVARKDELEVGLRGAFVKGGRAPVVFAVRTTEGRYAKCAAWQDAESRLHLRFRTYDTPVRLLLRADWTSTSGPRAPSGARQLAWGGTLSAQPTKSRSDAWRFVPVSYRWYWQGQELSGAGILPSTTTQYFIMGATCRLTTSYGETLRGEACVRATDAAGVQVTLCKDVSLYGTSDPPDPIRPDDLEPGFTPTLARSSGPSPEPDPFPRIPR